MLGSSGMQRHDAGAPNGSAGVRNGVGVSKKLRERMCAAAMALVGEVGYARTTMERVARLSGNSPDTFHKCFEDLEDCLLAAFEDAIERIAAVVAPAYEREDEWPAKVSAALTALLAMIEDEPAMSMFVFVGALGAGPKVLACRMEALGRLKIAFEHGIDEGVDGSALAESSPLSEIREFSPLSAEGAVNGMLGILHTRLLEGSPLARRPLSELAGPLTTMIVLPYVGHKAASSSASNGAGALAATTASSGPARRGSKVRPSAGARKRKRGRLTPKQRALVAELGHGPRIVRELVDATGLSDQTARQSLNRLEARERIVKTKRDGKIAYDLPAKARAAAQREATAGSSSSPESLRAKTAVGAASNGAGSSTADGAEALAATTASNGTGTSNGAGTSTSNGAGASTNSHDRSGRAKAMLEGLETPISEGELKVLTVIDQLNAQGSSPSNREIGNATQIYDPTQLSRLVQRLAQLWLVQNTATGRHAYAWRLTSKGTDFLRELEAHAVGAETPAALD
jgi:AcrR family transcriptional regulator